MIELEALKQQLALLGHTLPDDQIKAILQEMSIEVSEAAVPQSTSSAAVQPTADMPGHSFARAQDSYSAPSYNGFGGTNYETEESLAYGAPATFSSGSYGYTSLDNSLAYPATGPNRLAAVPEEDDCVLTRLSAEVSDLDFLQACAQPISSFGHTRPEPPAAPIQPTTSQHNPAPTSTASTASAMPSHAWVGSTQLDISTGSSPPPQAPTFPKPPSDSYREAHEWFGKLNLDSDSAPKQQSQTTPVGASLRALGIGASSVGSSGLKSGARRVPVYEDTETSEEPEVGDAYPQADAPARSSGAAGVAHRLYQEYQDDQYLAEEESDEERDEVDDILARYYGAAATKRSGGNSGSSQPHARSTRPASAAATTTEAAAAGANGVGSRLWGPAPTVPVRVGSSGGGTAHVPSSGGGGSRGACPDNEMAWGGAGVGGSHPTSLLRRATGDTLPRAMPTRPKKFDWQDHLRADDALRPYDQVPRASSGVARSVAGSSMSGKAGNKGAPKKVDRVARYQQLQKQWSSSKFLRSAALDNAKGSALGAASRSAVVATQRKPLNFHAYFKALHAQEAAERKGVITQARAKTATDLAPGSSYVAPNDKRRDALRTETRARMRAWE